MAHTVMHVQDVDQCRCLSTKVKHLGLWPRFELCVNEHVQKHSTVCVSVCVCVCTHAVRIYMDGACMCSACMYAHWLRVQKVLLTSLVTHKIST